MWSFGYMAHLKVVSGIPPEWGGLATLRCGCVSYLFDLYINRWW